MWSRKRRKKEGRGSGGGAQGAGKEGRASSAQPPSPRLSLSNKPTPNVRTGQVNSSLPPTPPLPPISTPPQTSRLEPHLPLANPNIKPGITVPLPPAPINPATILDSLKTSLQQHEIPPLIPPNSAAMGTGGVPVNSVGSVPVSMATGSSSVAVAQQQSDHLQRVIEAQRTQLNLLSQITRSLTEGRQRGTNQRGAPGVTRPGGGGQTFDYGSRGGGDLQSMALQQLDQQDYSVRGRWP